MVLMDIGAQRERDGDHRMGRNRVRVRIMPLIDPSLEPSDDGNIDNTERLPNLNLALPMPVDITVPGDEPQLLWLPMNAIELNLVAIRNFSDEIRELSREEQQQRLREFLEPIAVEAPRRFRGYQRNRNLVPTQVRNAPRAINDSPPERPTEIYRRRNPHRLARPPRYDSQRPRQTSQQEQPLQQPEQQ